MKEARHKEAHDAWLPYMKCTGKANLQRWKVCMWLPALDGWEQGEIANGYKSSFGVVGNVLKLDCGDGCSTLYIDYKSLNGILTMNELYDI